MVDLNNEHLMIIFSILTVIFGIFGNTISIFIFKSSKFKKHSSTFYSLVTCIINIITVIYFPFAIIPAIWNVNIVNCKIYLTFTLFIAEYQPWIITCSSLDRLAFTLSQNKYLFKDKLKFKLFVCLITAISIFILITPCIVFYTVDMNSDNQTMCTFSKDLKFIWILDYFKVQYLFLRIAIPFGIMITSSIIVSWRIYKRKLNLRQTEESKKSIEFMKTLVYLDLAYILGKLPMLIYLLTTNNGNDRIIYNFIYSLFATIGTLYNSLYFVILLILNKIYRSIFSIYLKRFCKIHSSAVVPINS